MIIAKQDFLWYKRKDEIKECEENIKKYLSEGLAEVKEEKVLNTPKIIEVVKVELPKKEEVKKVIQVKKNKK